MEGHLQKGKFQAAYWLCTSIAAFMWRVSMVTKVRLITSYIHWRKWSGLWIFFSQFYLNHYFHLCQLERESGNFIMWKRWRDLISCFLKLGFKIKRPLKTQLTGPSRLSVRKYKVWRNFIPIISFNLQPQPYYIQTNGFSDVKLFERYRIRSLSSWHCRKKTKGTIDLSKYSDLGL